MEQEIEARELLRRELTDRIAVNPRYSLRAFARALKMSPATLSQILSGKQTLTIKRVQMVSIVIGLTPLQQEGLKQQILKQKKALKNQTDFVDHGHNITMDIFSVLSDWYHYAILSLLELKESSLAPNWIVSKLGISKREAIQAIRRLKRLEMIKKKNGKWKQTALPLRVAREIANPAARRFQRQLLNKAIYALDNEPSERRDITSITFAMDSSDVNFASEKITEFRRRLSCELEKRGKPQSVYNLTIQLYPVTKE